MSFSSSIAQVIIHCSQFPDRVQRDLYDSLRGRQVNHKFHYDSVKQTQKWLALHEAYSPARTDPECFRVYDESFAAAVAQVPARQVQVIGLGCGGGQKDARLLGLLQAAGKEVFYTPVDVSAAMVLVARAAALQFLPDARCRPVVCDLATAGELPAVFAQVAPGARLITFFGMLPNFEPEVVLRLLREVVQPGDALLLSANLAPGTDYEAGVQKVMPLYDNELTRQWLMTFLLDLGVELADGRLEFVIEERPGPARADDLMARGLRRVTAWFEFTRRREIRVDAERFEFGPGERIRLFFSWRHTPAQVGGMLESSGLRLRGQWVTCSQEEGVFLADRGGSPNEPGQTPQE
jgi:L-histidine Nalpha-methyltransferase